VFSPTTYDWTDKRVAYEALVHDLTHLLGEERDPVANASQAAALIWHALPDLNWAGFYFFDGTELVVGPFQGLPACTRIALTRGVCGAAASRRESIVVPDVHAFPGTSPATVDPDPSWSCRSSPAAPSAASSTWTRRPGALRRRRSDRRRAPRRGLRRRDLPGAERVACRPVGRFARLSWDWRSADAYCRFLCGALDCRRTRGGRCNLRLHWLDCCESRRERPGGAPDGLSCAESAADDIEPSRIWRRRLRAVHGEVRSRRALGRQP
jgi:hypothetical protein